MSDVEIYTVKLHGSSKEYILLTSPGSNQDKFLQDVRKIRYCNVLKRPIEDLENPAQVQEVYEQIKASF